MVKYYLIKLKLLECLYYFGFLGYRHLIQAGHSVIRLHNDGINIFINPTLLISVYF